MNHEISRVVFFIPQWPVSDAGVIHSQVLAVARFLSVQGFDCLFVGCEFPGVNEQQTVTSIMKTYGIEGKVFGIYSSKYGYLSLALTARKLYKSSREVIRSFQPTHIYSRSLLGAKYARKIAKDTGALSIFDVRAAISEETLLRSGRKSLWYWYIKYLEKREIQKASRLSCVSENLKTYITARVKDREISVIPCCVGGGGDKESRNEIRVRLGFTKKHKVICYSGGGAIWQRFDDIVALFEKISQSEDGADFRFLFLSYETQKLKSILINSNLSKDKYELVGCPQKEVYKYLSAADAGVILRHNTIVNNVASPIKIGEYLACGLPLILTAGIGDFSELIPKVGIGMLLDESIDYESQVIEYLTREDIAEIGDKAIKFSAQYFFIGTYLNEYKKLYN